MSFLDFKHLVLVDLNSNGLFFYLAKDVKNLPALDFAGMTLLAKVDNQELCQRNLLADDQQTIRLIEQKLRDFDLREYKLVFLLSKESSALEKALLTKAFPFWQKIELVERHFFYNFYLMQKRNFSPVKFLVNVFADCAELSLFKQENLLADERVELYNLPERCQIFLTTHLAKNHLKKPECFYFFTNNLPGKMPAGELAKHLKMEAITIEQLC